MKAIIIEDNVSNSWDYEMILNDFDIQVNGIFKSSKAALQEIRNEIPDFMIVDLILDNGENGLDFIHDIKHYFIPTIICTAYPKQKYIDKAINVGVVAFISKPIDKANLAFQIKKLVKEIQSNNKIENYLVVKDKRKYIKIPFREIYKIETEGNYSYIFLESGKKHVLKISLINFIKQLDTAKFIRCFRSTIVNLEYIDFLDLQENKIYLINGMVVPIGTTYRISVKNAFAMK